MTVVYALETNLKKDRNVLHLAVRTCIVMNYAYYTLVVLF